MPTSSLFTERIDGINGFVNIPAANSTLFWRNGSGVIGTLPTSTFVTPSGDNEFTGANYFSNIIFNDSVEHSGASVLYTSSNFTFDEDSKDALLGALELDTVAKKDAANIFTGTTTYSATAGFNYDTAAQIAHRTALGLGTLATQSGTFTSSSVSGFHFVIEAAPAPTDQGYLAFDTVTNQWKYGNGISTYQLIDSNTIQTVSNKRVQSCSILNNIGTRTSPFTADDDDSTILCNTAGGGFTITLPAASINTRRVYTIKKISSDGNTVTIDGNGAETIDGVTTKTLTTQWQFITIKCNGTGWFVIG